MQNLDFLDEMPHWEQLVTSCGCAETDEVEVYYQCGAEVLKTMWACLPSMTIYFAAKNTGKREQLYALLVKTCGAEVADALLREFAGYPLRWGKKVLHQLKRRYIKEHRNDDVLQLAVKVGVSQRTIERVRNRTAGALQKQKQPSLFDR